MLSLFDEAQQSHFPPSRREADTEGAAVKFVTDEPQSGPFSVTGAGRPGRVVCQSAPVSAG